MLYLYNWLTQYLLIRIIQYLRLLQVSRAMDQLMSLIDQTVITFNSVLEELAEVQYKQDLDKGMDIEDEPIHQPKNGLFNDYDSDIELAFFDELPENVYSEALDSKIANIKMNSVSVRRKDELFKRQKREQQQKIIQRRKQIEQKYPFDLNDLKFQGQFLLKSRQKNQIFTFKFEDFDKLRPETDLNDTIIDNYLKLMQISIIPEEVSRKTFVFSTFFMSRLLGEYLKQDNYIQRQTDLMIDRIKKKVADSYLTMKRWTKKIDLFSMQYIVVPINAFKHWNSMIVVSPGYILSDPSLCKIVYLDSMCQKKSMFSEAIKTFLQLELADRRNINLSLENTVHTYQLLIPRQTNTHDCGLYTLCYIEHFLKNHELIDENMQSIQKREHLRLFPRSVIFTMRQCLRRLFKSLLTNENREQSIKQYLKQRGQVQKNCCEGDFDEINERQLKKYYRLNCGLLQDKKKKQSQIQYQCKVKFYLDTEVNHYEKDTLVP